MFLDIQPYRSITGGSLMVSQATLTAGQVFVQGDLVAIVAAGTISGFPQDGTKAIPGDFGSVTGMMVGVAANGPGQAASAELTRTRAMINPATGLTYATGDVVSYYPALPGALFKAQVLAAGGASAGVGLTTHKGELFQLNYCNATTPDLGWGVDLTAGVPGTDICARIWDVLGSDGRRSETAGTHFVFEIITGLPGAAS